jgi:8-oxo-dGTP diphosphatase
VEILDALDAVTPVRSALVLLRHSEAMKRKDWDRKDTLRPLTEDGLAAADRLVDVLAALGVNRIFSSDAERCTATVAPYAAAIGRPVHLHPEISERGFEADPTGLEGLAGKTWKPGRITVVCSHRPVLPSLSKELGLRVGKFSPGAFLVAHQLEDGRLVYERFRAP